MSQEYQKKKSSVTKSFLKNPIDHFAKTVQIRSFFWSVFPRIQSKYGKIQTRNNSVFGLFSCSLKSTKTKYILFTGP